MLSVRIFSIRSVVQYGRGAWKRKSAVDITYFCLVGRALGAVVSASRLHRTRKKDRMGLLWTLVDFSREFRNLPS